MTYLIRKVKDYYEVTNTEENFVSYRVKNKTCNCPGFYMQKDKSNHKHIKLVEFWKKELKEEYGYALWFNGEKVEYNKWMKNI